jgi:hypothetical protein
MDAYLADIDVNDVNYEIIRLNDVLTECELVQRLFRPCNYFRLDIKRL